MEFSAVLKPSQQLSENVVVSFYPTPSPRSAPVLSATGWHSACCLKRSEATQSQAGIKRHMTESLGSAENSRRIANTSKHLLQLQRVRQRLAIPYRLVQIPAKAEKQPPKCRYIWSPVIDGCRKAKQEVIHCERKESWAGRKLIVHGKGTITFHEQYWTREQRWFSQSLKWLSLKKWEASFSVLSLCITLDTGGFTWCVF